jgi:hypothetical protein
VAYVDFKPTFRDYLSGPIFKGQTVHLDSNNPEDGRIQFKCGRSLRSHKCSAFQILRSIFARWLWAGQLRNCGSIPSRSKGFYLSLKCTDRVWGPPNLLFSMCQGVPSLGVMWPERDAETSRLSRAEAKDCRSCTFTSPHTFTACTGTLYYCKGQPGSIAGTRLQAEHTGSEARQGQRTSILQ